MRHQEVAAVRAQWMNDRGDSWIHRNANEIDHEKTDHVRFGGPRRPINEEFLADVSRDSQVLEVGSGFGLLLNELKELGFRQRVGVDLNLGGLHMSEHRGIQADACSLPFPDESFDLVCTNGTLMHIHPLQLRRVTDEIVRVTRRWIWSFEPVAAKLHTLNFSKDLNMPPAWIWDLPLMVEVLQPTLGLTKGRIWRNDDMQVAMTLYEKDTESLVWF